MKIVFLSNYFNHHQKYLSDSLYKLTKGNYYFIQTTIMEEDRIKLGWNNDNLPKYVIKSFQSNKEYERCISLIDNADVVIIGSANYKFIKNRIKLGKITFRYSERFLKTKRSWLELPIRSLKYINEGGRKDNLYLLCASAYASHDYNLSYCYRNRCFKWGYFPKTNKFDNINEIINLKNKYSILWVGRLINWKHPEIPIYLAEKLKKEGLNFKLNIIGDGVLKDEISRLVYEKKLENYVTLIGAIPSDRVQEYMRKSNIFISSSDYNEGWGAVINEAMGNACAVVASKEMGSVPYLISNGENGFSYKYNNVEHLSKIIKMLLSDDELCKKVQVNAYETIQKVWNGEEAAKRFVTLSYAIINGDNYEKIFTDGPCSKI